MKNCLLHHIIRRCRSSLLLTAGLLCLSLTSHAIDTVYINSQADWTTFCSKYNATEVNVFLNCDVKIETKGYQMYNFIGTLDGQGHAFILNYKDDKDGDQNKDYYDSDWNEDSAPFLNAQGTIKNLRLTGTVAIRYGTTANRTNCPLVEDVHKDTLTIENCYSDVAFVNTGTMAPTFGNYAYIGGFVGTVLTNAVAIFNNCAFTGSFTYTDPDEGHNYYDTGGFVGYTNSDKGIIFNNCFSYVTYDDRGTVKSFSYFVGTDKCGNGFKLNNCYGYCENESGEVKTLPNDEKCTELVNYGGIEFIRNGGLTMLLNANSDGSNPWAQTVGTDAVPKLKVTSPESETLVNLVTNGYFNDDLTGWTSDRVPDSASSDDNGNYFWRSDFREIHLTQTIDLTKYYSEDELDNYTYKAVMACDWANQWGYKLVSVYYGFCDADDEYPSECEILNTTDNSTELDALTWNSVGYTFPLPAGIRKVKVILTGQDYKHWSGNLGPAFDNVSLALVRTADQPTVISTVPLRPTPADSRRYTLGGTPAGKGAKGIIIQGGKKYIQR